MLVVGDQEETDGTVTPRRRHGPEGSDATVALDAFVAGLAREIAERRHHPRPAEDSA
jgi:threonyl-tRNA synthetase